MDFSLLKRFRLYGPAGYRSGDESNMGIVSSNSEPIRWLFREYGRLAWSSTWVQKAHKFIGSRGLGVTGANPQRDFLNRGPSMPD
jgi:hypothetical protein